MKPCAAALLCLLATLTACHGDSGEAPKAAAAAPKAAATVLKPTPGPTAAEQTAGMVEASALGKSQLPVQLKFDLSERPVRGRPLTIALAVLPQLSADQASLEVSGSEALQVASPGTRSLGALEPAQVVRQSLHLTAAQDGIQLLEVKLTVHHDEQSETREFAIPLIIAAEGAAKVP